MLSFYFRMLGLGNTNKNYLWAGDNSWNCWDEDKWLFETGHVKDNQNFKV